MQYIHNKPFRILLCCCCFTTYRKTILTHEIVEPPIARHKKRFLNFITFTFAKIFHLGHDKFPRDTQSIGSPVINPSINGFSNCRSTDFLPPASNLLFFGLTIGSNIFNLFCLDSLICLTATLNFSVVL